MRIKVVSFLILIGFLSLLPCKGNALPFDSASLLKVYEDSMKAVQFIRINARSDKEKMEANTKLYNWMSKALALPTSFDYPFDSLKTIGRLMSPDKQFRIINWDVPVSGGKVAYYGFIQSFNAKKKKYDVFVLTDKTEDIINPQNATCTPDKWMGMLYFKIIKEKGVKFYTLLAWEGVSKQITRKVIDILTFNSQGIPTFGKAVFMKLPSTYKGAIKRMIFEYSADVTMSLSYNDPKNQIVFDLLGPREDGLEGQHQYYGPSFQIDGLNWRSGMWEYISNVKALNPNDKGDPKYKDPKNDDYKINKKVYKTK